MFKIVLEKGNRYWDPLTNTHLKRTDRERIFTDEQIESFDMSNIKYACTVGVVRKIDLDKDVDKSVNEDKEVLDALSDDKKVMTQDEDTQTANDEETQKETEEEVQTGAEEEVSDTEDEESVDEFVQCIAETSSGSQCKNEAKYPEEDPVVCHVHKGKLDE